jgi:hypothetical protein
MRIKCTDKQGNIVAMFESDQPRNIATNQAIDLALKSTNFFAVYVDGQLDCYSESSDRFQFPKTIVEIV